MEQNPQKVVQHFPETVRGSNKKSVEKERQHYDNALVLLKNNCGITGKQFHQPNPTLCMMGHLWGWVRSGLGYGKVELRFGLKTHCSPA